MALADLRCDFGRAFIKLLYRQAAAQGPLQGPWSSSPEQGLVLAGACDCAGRQECSSERSFCFILRLVSVCTTRCGCLRRWSPTHMFCVSADDKADCKAFGVPCRRSRPHRPLQRRA